MRTTNRPIRVAIVAGEASGDLLGAHLIEALKNSVEGIEFEGIVGPKMEAQGARALWPMEKLAVRGYIEVLKHYREIVGIRRALRKRLLANPPDLFIGIDAPDFNLDLEVALKAAGIPVIHYVSPSIWAWRGERIHKIGRAVTHMLTLFPFEKPIYDAAGIPATYVGHPLADMLPLDPDRAAARTALKLEADRPVVAMLPGSRQSEVRTLAPVFLKAASIILKQFPDTEFLVPLISRETRQLFEMALATETDGTLPVKMLFGHAHAAMTAANAVMVACGTATLEAALIKRPMAMAYRVPRLTFWLMKRKAYVTQAGLPNLLAGQTVAPEFLQEACTPEGIATALIEYLADASKEAALYEAFRNLHLSLRQNTAATAARVVLEVLNAR